MRRECTRKGKMAGNIGLSQGKKNPIIFSCFDELTSLQAYSPFSRDSAPWKYCILIPFIY